MDSPSFESREIKGVLKKQSSRNIQQVVHEPHDSSHASDEELSEEAP